MSVSFYYKNSLDIDKNYIKLPVIEFMLYKFC